MAQYTLDHLKYNGSNDIWEITDSAARGSLAAAYSASSTYAVGDIVLKDGKLYRCNTAITSAEAWTAAHWTAVTVGEKIADLEHETSVSKEDLSNTNSSILSVSAPNVPASAWTKGGINGTTGRENDTPTLIRTGFFPIDDSAIYTFTGNTGSGRVWFNYFYDSDRNYITRSVGAIPSGSKYVRFCYGFTTTSGITIDSYGFENVIADWSCTIVPPMQKQINDRLKTLDDSVTALEIYDTEQDAEINQLKSDLSSSVNPFASKWIIGKTIDGEGAYNNNIYSATTPLLYDSTDKYQYTGATKDSNNVGFYLFVHEYDGNFNWLDRRTVFGISDTVTIPIDIERSSSNVKFFRFVFGRNGNSGVEFSESDLSYIAFSQVQNKANMIPIQPNPIGYVSDGTANALFSLAEEYLNYAYQKENISGLIYASENADSASSAYSETVTPIQTVGGIKQYSIQCSGLANLLIRAVTFDNSRYITGTSGRNISQNWGYRFDDSTLAKNPTKNNILWSYELYKYAVEHGFAYIVNQTGNNVRPGDLLFTSSFTATRNYMQIGHAMVVLNCGEDGKATVVEASSDTRTSGGVDYPVGLRVHTYDLTASNNQIIYGARYPLGSVDKKADTIFTYNPNFTGTTNNNAIINKSIGVEGLAKQGLYTIVARGDFSSIPNVVVKYVGGSSYVSVGKMNRSGNIYTLSFYLPDEITVVALSNGSGSQMTVSGFDYMRFAHGYINPNVVDEEQWIDYPDNGYTLNGGEDLNDLPVGDYMCGSGTIAQSLLNCPVSVNFRMVCRWRIYTYMVQIIYASDNSIYMRNQSSSSWGKWYKFTGTAMS